MEHVAGVIYGEKAGLIREQIYEMPEPLRTTILLIDLDTELAMNGMLGFLENSTGQYLNETMTALKLIGAVEDAAIMQGTQELAESTLLNKQVNLEPYEISTFQERHQMDDEVLEKIEMLADKLYIYSADRSIFDYLISYLADNWDVTLNYLRIH